MAKKYFNEDYSEYEENLCYELSYFKDYMKENNIKELTLFEAKRITGVDFFFCKEFQEVGEKGQYSCGIVCECYKPRNGKNGRCVHSGYTYEPTDKKKILKLK